MKNIIYISIFSLILFAQNSFSQQIGDLNGIYYQAVALDDEGKEIVGMDVEGKPLYNKAIGVRFSLTKGLNGPVLWEETHTTNTDKYGLFSLLIGQGQTSGNCAYSRLLDMPWIDADQFLKVEISTKNDGNYKLVSNQQFMSVPYSFYTDDIADDAITTSKILDSAIINMDIHTGAVDSRTLLDETILAEDIHTGAVTSSKILDSTIVNEDINIGAVDSRTLLDETILAEDIHTGAVTSDEILDSTLVNDDINIGAVDSRTLLDETILAEDIHTGAVTSDEILDSTLVNDDINIGAVDSRTLLDETILAEDIHTGAVTSDEILDSTLVNQDINSDAVDSRTILDETIVAGDIATSAVTTSEILNGTVVNEDIADATINLTTKITGVLPVENGGMGNANLSVDRILVGNGTDPINAKVLASADTSIQITQTADSIIIKGRFAATEVTSDPAGTFNIPQIMAGSTWTSNAINYQDINFGDIIIGSIDMDLQGCMLTAYVSQPNVIRVSIFNGTGSNQTFGNNINLRVFVVK